MNLEDSMLSELSRSKKDKYCVIPLIGAFWNSQIHRIRRLNGGCQGLGGRGEWGLVVLMGTVSVLQDGKVLQIGHTKM